MNNIKTIATHSGPFQCDEVFGVAMLMLINPDIKLVRTRDPDEFSKADLRLDVGMKYDASTQDYDHHQKEGAGERANGTPYAAAGLIWKHFGMELAKTEDVWQRIDEKIIQFIDAQDNGISTYESDTAKPYTVADIVKTFNPGWYEQNADYDAAFMRAVELAKDILTREIRGSLELAEATTMVREAITKSDGHIIVLDRYCPWKKVVVEETDAEYVVYPNISGSWCVQTVPIRTDSFESRRPLPEAWAGADAVKLAELTGVKDAVFCHRNLFIAGAESKEGALKLAQLALE